MHYNSGEEETVEDLLFPFGDSFHAVVVTVSSANMRSSLSLLKSVLELGSVRTKPFAGMRSNGVTLK